MAYNFYSAYRSSLMRDPVTTWREDAQQAINDTWLDTSTVTDVQGQTALGSKTYQTESVQLNSVFNPATGKDFGDNYRKIIYQNLADNELPPEYNENSNRFLGKYYQFNNYTWLTVNTNTTIGAVATAILKRCNNWLRWYDQNGVLHEWECVFERSLGGTNIDYGKEGIDEVSADTLIQVQLNAETSLIPFNQRFVFNGHSFQVKQINNHISTTYLELYLYEVQVQANDDVINDVANTQGEIIGKETKTILLPQINKINQGTIQEFSVYRYVEGVKTGATYTISVTGGAEGVNYTLTIVNGNNFKIKNILQSDTPIVVNCVNTLDSTDSVSMTILLGGAW